MELYELVSKSFSNVINTDSFVLGIDQTGVYAFTEQRSVIAANTALRELKEDLALSDEQVVLCIVSEDSVVTEHPTHENLNEWVLKESKKREKVLTQEAIKEIINCYNYVSVKEEKIKVLEQLGLTREVSETISAYQQVTINDLARMGIEDEELQDAIIRTATESDDEPFRLVSAYIEVNRVRLYVAIGCMTIATLLKIVAVCSKSDDYRYGIVTSVLLLVSGVVGLSINNTNFKRKADGFTRFIESFVVLAVLAGTILTATDTIGILRLLGQI